MERKLILKLNKMWGIFDIGGHLVPLPTQPILCPFCGSEMYLHDFRAYKHTSGVCHIDVHIKCPSCGFHHSERDFVFGLPIPCELVPKLQKSKYHGKTLRLELREIGYEIDKEMEERIRGWGYW